MDYPSAILGDHLLYYQTALPQAHAGTPVQPFGFLNCMSLKFAEFLFWKTSRWDIPSVRCLKIPTGSLQ